MTTPVDKHLRSALQIAKERGWASVDDETARSLASFSAELLKWNRKINLTAISDPGEVAELHFLDSLAIVPYLAPDATLLDVGTGGGFPGLPAAIVRPDLKVTLVDRTEKKVTFLKNTIARLALANANARHLRVEGKPDEEGLGRYDVVVSRAFTAPDQWFPLAAPYARKGGLVIAMVGSEESNLQGLADGMRARLEEFESIRYELPSGQKRGLLLWRPAS